MRMCREYMAMIRVIANRIVRNLPIQTVVPLMIMLVGAGCASDRLITTVYGKDYGTTINTRFRYNLVNRPDLQSQVERLQPNVFSRTGIPVEINDDGFFVKDHEIGYWDDLNGFTLLVYFASFGTLPTVCSHDEDKRVIIQNIGADKIGKRINMHFDYKGTMTFFPPLGMICLRCDGSESVENGRAFVSSGLLIKNLVRDTCNEKLVEAVAYGVASRLKEMEDLGQIDESIFRRMKEAAAAERERQLKKAAEEAERKRRDLAMAEQRARAAAAEAERLRAQAASRTAMQKMQIEQANKPPYHIIDLVREKGSDFAYAFSLELDGNASIQTFFGVQNIFANEVRAAYQMEYPNADMSSLRVVVQPSLSNGRIVGRAEVLTIAPIALSYDASARLGRLSVRFNSSQYEEARAWARKNIETLARDKNIVLVSGEIPPAARFYSLGESLKNGNILEIEFKTE